MTKSWSLKNSYQLGPDSTKGPKVSPGWTRDKGSNVSPAWTRDSSLQSACPSCPFRHCWVSYPKFFSTPPKGWITQEIGNTGEEMVILDLIRTSGFFLAWNPTKISLMQVSRQITQSRVSVWQGGFKERGSKWLPHCLSLFPASLKPWSCKLHSSSAFILARLC